MNSGGQLAQNAEEGQETCRLMFMMVLDALQVSTKFLDVSGMELKATKYML